MFVKHPISSNVEIWTFEFDAEQSNIVALGHAENEVSTQREEESGDSFQFFL